MAASIDEQLDAATELALSGESAVAIAAVQALLVQEPESGDGWLTLATLLSAARRWLEADQAFARTTALPGARAETYLAWARVLEKLARVPEALQALTRAHELAPHSVEPLREFAFLLYHQGRYEDALREFERAKERAPRDARVAYAIGLCREARGEHAAAIADYRQACALDPHLAAPRNALADLLAQLGEHDRAIAELDVLLRLERTNEQAAQNREVLARALHEMHERRLLGKGEREWELSPLLLQGALRKVEPSGHDPRADVSGPGTRHVRYASRLLNVHLTFEAGGRAREGSLVLQDPARAARQRDNLFGVTVVAESGVQVPADLATAASLTFLREGLGISLTQASQVYRRALAREPDLTVGGAQVAFTTLTGAESSEDTAAHGLTIALI